MQTSVTSFNQTLEKSHAWLKELKDIGNFNSGEEAYTALRAVMHSLRDRLAGGWCCASGGTNTYAN